MPTDRRSFLKQILIGSAGLAGGIPAMSFTRTQTTPAPAVGTPASRVIFRTGSDRRKMMLDVLTPLKSEIRTAIGRRQVLIKPNFVVSRAPLCATHVDATRGVLDFLKSVTSQQVWIAESPASGDAERAFDVYGYNALKNEYNVRLVDLNAEPTIEVGPILMRDDTTTHVRLIKALVDKRNYVISVCRPKTHDSVIATLTTKNVLMAAPWRGAGQESDKVKMHGGKIAAEGNQVLTKNLNLVSDLLLPDLAVVDGLEGMEGNGPVGGTPIEHKIALAGTDCIAVDAVGVKLMGINPAYLPYLAYCERVGRGNYAENRIKVDGPDLKDFIKKYKLPDSYETQISWIKLTP